MWTPVTFMARCDLGPLLTERLGARENPCRLSDNLSPMPRSGLPWLL
jgi:hypothetical protein